MNTTFRLRKTWVVIIGIALLCFVVWSLSWFVYVKTRYSPFLENIPKNIFGTHHIVDSEGYNFNVQKPAFLFFTGNLGSVAPDDAVSLIIWPKVLGGYEYGVRIHDESGGYEIMVDANGNALRTGQREEEYKQMVEVIQRNKEGIQKIFDKVKKQWHLT